MKKAAPKKKDTNTFTFELGLPAKGLSPPTLQSTPTTSSKPTEGNVPGTPKPSSSESSSSDGGVQPHPSPKVRKCVLLLLLALDPSVTHFDQA